MKITRTRTAAALVVGALALTGCTGEPAADVGNRNLDTAADNFEILRSVTAINTRDPKTPLYTIEGFCSVKKADGDFHATCKEPDGTLKRYSVIVSTDVTAVVVQLESAKIDTFRSRVIWRPQSLLPDYDLSTRSNPSEPGGPQAPK